MRKRAALTLATTAALAALSASAQTKKADITGPWRFETAVFDEDCKMTGVITFDAPNAKDVHACRFTTETRCTIEGEGVYEYWRVKHSCSATQAGDAVRITSKIDRIESAKWFDEEMTAKEKAEYVADMFNLTLTRSGDEMNGLQFDPVRRVKTRMWREADLVG